MRRIGQVVLILVLLACSGYATTVTTFNTGVDFNAVTFIDQHYTLAFDAATPGAGAPGPAYFVDPSKPPISNGQWFADTSTSAWIGARHDESTGGDVAGYYTYTTTFDLTGLDPTTASLTGQWSTDNPGIEIILNSTVFNTAPYTTPDNAFSTGFYPYTIGSGFVPGVNTIQYVIRNDFCSVPDSCGINPTGFRNEYSVTATTSSVPEPGSLALLATGIFGFILPKLRRMKS